MRHEWTNCSETSTTRCLRRNPSFRDHSWGRVALEGGLDIGEDRSAALSDMAQSLGDDTVIVTDVESLPAHQFTAEVDWSYEAVEHARVRSDLGLFDTHLFGRSGRWGAIAWRDDYVMVAAAPTTIRQLMDALGGERKLRDEFEAFVRLQRPWLDPASLWPPSSEPL
jgi:hypothetical protein